MTAHPPQTTPLVFIIFDGWGNAPDSKHNAISQANTPNWDQLLKISAVRAISGSGVDVGLPDGQMGNSEVGHMHIGAGRIIYQDFTRINQAINDGGFAKNPTLLNAMQFAKAKQKRVHLLGLLSPGGVHSHQDHGLALIDMAADLGIQDCHLHAFLDGRDTPPQSAEDYLETVEKHCQVRRVKGISSICGRYYAMDRDQRWARTQRAYDCLTQIDDTSTEDEIFHASSAKAGLAAAYARKENDEFVQPTRINGKFEAITDDDVVIFFNFRSDRARQLSRAFTQADFVGFKRQQIPKLSHFVSMTQYAKDIPSEIAFPPQQLKNTFGEVLAKHHRKQTRIAETEKYAHVTFFFNGGREQPFEGEDRILIPSPKSVATYDLKPEMSAYDITDAIVKTIEAGETDVIITNFANPDMVGHTGNFEATVKAIEVIDDCLGKIRQAQLQHGGELLITADHGNAEKMFDEETQQVHTAHTTSPVPLVYAGRKAKFDEAPANLADIAPTMLYLLGLPIPKEMTGRVLLAV